MALESNLQFQEKMTCMGFLYFFHITLVCFGITIKAHSTWQNLTFEPFSLLPQSLQKIISIMLLHFALFVILQFIYLLQSLFFKKYQNNLKSYEESRATTWNYGWNGILLPKLFWPTVRKNCSSDWEKLLEITRTTYSNSERSELFKIVSGCFLD